MRILFVTPSFFGYEHSIVEAFEQQGHQVDLFDERPSNAPLAKVLVRVFPALLSRQVRRHFSALEELLSDREFDLLLVVKGEVLPRRLVELFAERNPQAPRVFYSYDSLRNSPQARRTLDAFTHKFTFDREDADEIRGFHYKPLFFVSAYAPSGQARHLDLSFVGTLHGDRYSLTQAVAAVFPGSRVNLFYFIPAAWYFWIRKAVSAEVRHVRRSEVSTKPLKQSDVVRMVRDSRAVIDVQRPGQSGLTMRTFEVLAAGAALITTNDAIRHEKFYDPDRVLVIPRNPDEIDPSLVRDFVARQPTIGHPPPTIADHSLHSWVLEFTALRHGPSAVGAQ